MVIVKDEAYGTIEFDELEERIIDTPGFQRLRRITQMSVTNLVYPGANHTRFEHSLGTAYLSSLIAGKLGFDEDGMRKIKLFGLLHDIGHVAFSHEGEDVLRKYIGDHETLGREMIRKGGIADILNENYSAGEIADMHGSRRGMIVEADIGADRMDYLKRDALNTGVAYGVIDIDRIVHTLAVEGDELCVTEGGLEAAESLLVARFMMFSAVYLHKTVRIATAMLHRAIEKSIADKTIKPEEFINMGDEVAYWRMLQSPSAREYAEGLLKRRLYKEIASIPEKSISRKEAEKLERELSAKFGCDIMIDYPTQFSKTVELKVKTKGGLRPLTELSTLVGSLQKAEEERRRILVLADEETRKSKGELIRKAIHAPA
ncbi:HD domain-containing protein [Candidatus Micrarchaeota archaeon]|nr:HD domain-containing protein [Candidatus Micrarchaeota archaeon]